MEKRKASHTKAPGMGAVAHAAGTTFRVWAPHADAVFVKGDLNNWHATACELTLEDQGVWAVNVPGVGAGAQYKFSLVCGEQTLDRIDPYAKEVTNSVGCGVVVDPASFDWGDSAFTPPPHNELVIYEMHVGSFNAVGNSPGTLASALQRLPHLRSLGVNAIEVMPIAEFAGDYSWGYNPAHMFAVESAYGGPAAFKTFVREAHRQGFAVILDVVYNHFGPSDLDLWRFDGWSENDGGGIYFYNDHRASTPWGNTRPDYGRGEVRQFIRDNALMWLDDYRVDGLRMDMTLYIRSVAGVGNDDLPEGWTLLQWVNGEVRERFPQAILISEDLRNHAAMTDKPEAGGAGFHAQWDASFVHPVRAAVIAPDDGQRSMVAVRDAFLNRYNDDAFRRVIYSESHDEVANGKARVPQEIDGANAQGWFARKRSTLAAALVMTAPGIPMLFQGQEFLEGEWFRDDVPLDWAQQKDFHGIVLLYRDLVSLRRNLQGLTRGLSGQGASVHHLNDALNIISFQRWDQHGPGDDVMVVFNFSADPRQSYALGFPTAGLWHVVFNSDSQFYSADFSNFESKDVLAVEGECDGLKAHAQVDIAPYSALIFSQKR